MFNTNIPDYPTPAFRVQSIAVNLIVSEGADAASVVRAINETLLNVGTEYGYEVGRTAGTPAVPAHAVPGEIFVPGTPATYGDPIRVVRVELPDAVIGVSE